VRTWESEQASDYRATGPKALTNLSPRATPSGSVRTDVRHGLKGRPKVFALRLIPRRNWLLPRL